MGGLICFNNRWVERLILRRDTFLEETLCIYEVFRLFATYGRDYVTGLIGMLETMGSVDVVTYSLGEYIGIQLNVDMEEFDNMGLELGDDVIDEIYYNTLYPLAGNILRDVESIISDIMIEFIHALERYKRVDCELLSVKGCISKGGVLVLGRA